MNFIEKIKESLNDPRERTGTMGTRVCVDAKSLRYLVDDYERMDTAYRAQAMDCTLASLERILSCTIVALYCQYSKNSDAVLLTFMKTLVPLIEDTQKELRIRKYFKE